MDCSVGMGCSSVEAYYFVNDGCVVLGGDVGSIIGEGCDSRGWGLGEGSGVFVASD